MKFICKRCGVTFERDMRLLCNKASMTKRGYKSSCEKTNEVSYSKPVTKYVTRTKRKKATQAQGRKR